MQSSSILIGMLLIGMARCSLLKATLHLLNSSDTSSGTVPEKSGTALKSPAARSSSGTALMKYPSTLGAQAELKSLPCVTRHKQKNMGSCLFIEENNINRSNVLFMSNKQSHDYVLLQVSIILFMLVMIYYCDDAEDDDYNYSD